MKGYVFYFYYYFCLKTVYAFPDICSAVSSKTVLASVRIGRKM